jgi:3-deoxy-7-phosphoheptulonate synthase
MPQQGSLPPTLEPLPSPNALKAGLPVDARQKAFVDQSRQGIIDILSGRTSRVLFVVGPCSIHDTTAAHEFATNLRQLADHVSSHCQLVMRAYFEKPRTGLGWRGMLYDPHLDGSNDIVNGLRQSRRFLLDLASMHLAAATEFLDPTTPSYLGDLISWGSVGSRTAESQSHRQMISALSTPVGFKNGTDGNLDVAINGLLVAGSPHGFIGINDDGQVSLVRSRGNPNCHVVLRGGDRQPNYDPQSVQETLKRLAAKGLPQRVVIDCSHDNSGKDPEKQIDVFHSVIEQIVAGNDSIVGLLLESHLKRGSQILEPGKPAAHGLSVTDPCLDWETTEELILWAYEALRARVPTHVE